MSIRSVLAAPLVLSLSACAPAAPPATPRVVFLADAIETAAHDEWHYAPVVRSGDLVVLSGIPAGRGATDEEKIRNAFARAGRALAAAGATFDDVVEITTYHTAPTHDDFERAFAAVSKVHATVFHPPYPAWTAIGNAALLNKDAILEMRIVAVAGSGRGARVERKAAPAP
jgi:enamine deaminase RidA (YjgF/YER057c/UK114 family)